MLLLIWVVVVVEMNGVDYVVSDNKIKKEYGCSFLANVKTVMISRWWCVRYHIYTKQNSPIILKHRYIHISIHYN